MNRPASAVEIRDAVAQARKLRPEIPDGLTAQFYAAGMTMEQVGAKLFNRITARDPNANEVIPGGWRRPGPSGGEAA